MNHIVLVQMLPVPRISGHLQRIKLPASVHSLSKIRSDHIGHYCLSKMVGPGNAHILGRFPLTGSRLLCHILVLLHKRYKITQNLPLVHKTGEGTCLTKEAVGTCGVQVKSHWSIPFSWIIRPWPLWCQYIRRDHLLPFCYTVTIHGGIDKWYF